MTTVTLCKCKDDPRVVSKVTEGDISRNCTIYGDCSIHNPSILIDYFSGLEHYNYAKFSDRWYWIEDIILKPGVRALLNLREDVLATHAREIRAISKFRVMRNETVCQPLLADGEYPVLVTNNIKREYFSNEVFNGQYYMLTVLGGGYTSS